MRCVRSSGTSTVAPKSSNKRRIVIRSRTYGTLRSVTDSGVSKVAARQGSAEFLAPLTATLPRKVFPPMILNLSIGFRVSTAQ